MLNLRVMAAMGALLCCSVVLCGCWVYSAHPLIDDEHELVFDKGLLGNWWQPEAGCTLTLSRFFEEKAYTVLYSSPPAGKGGGCLLDPGKSAMFEGRMIDLAGYRFLDLYPSDREKQHHTMSLHSFYKVKTQADTLILIPLDNGWVRAQLADNRLSIPASEQPQEVVVLTPATRELQQFVRDNAANEEAFNPGAQIVFRRRSDQ